MDLSRLSMGDKVILGSAIALFITLFLPWFSIDGGLVGDVGISGYDTGGFLFAIIPLLLAIVMAAQIALARFASGTQLPQPPVPWGQVHLIAGVAALVLVALKLLIGESDLGTDVIDRSYGLFLSLLAAAGLAAGGFLKSQEGEPASSTTGSPPRVS